MSDSFYPNPKLLKGATWVIVIGAAAASFSGIFNGLNQTCCGDKDKVARDSKNFNLVLATAMGALALMSLYPLMKTQVDDKFLSIGAGSMFLATLATFLLGRVRAGDVSETCKTTPEWALMTSTASAVVGLAGLTAIGGFFIKKKTSGD